MAMYNPFRGCHKFSEGCKYCYIHKGDARRKIDTNIIVKTKNFTSIIDKNNKGEYKVKAGQMVYMCFSTDFLIQEADVFRNDCWKMIKQRSDLHFIFLTKRIERFIECIPSDWADGYDNVTVGCTVENQIRADQRLEIFSKLPIKHKNIICQPLIENVEIEKYLKGIELVVLGGESDKNGRILDCDWVLNVRKQCINKNVSFEFRQCSTNFYKDSKLYILKVKDLASQGRKANLNFKSL